MKPVRLQRSRQSALVSPNGLPVVCVDRSTCWGNPHKVGAWVELPATKDFVQITHAMAVKMFRDSVIADSPILKFRRSELWKLRGKNLACWCAKNQPCHSDVLLTLANGEIDNA